MFFRKYPQKLWGMPTNIIRSDWAPKRITIRENIDNFFKVQFVATCRKGAGNAYKNIYEPLIVNPDEISIQGRLLAVWRKM